mgnify:CR=1 FL=1
MVAQEQATEARAVEEEVPRDAATALQHEAIDVAVHVGKHVGHGAFDVLDVPGQRDLLEEASQSDGVEVHGEVAVVGDLAERVGPGLGVGPR